MRGRADLGSPCRVDGSAHPHIPEPHGELIGSRRRPESACRPRSRCSGRSWNTDPSTVFVTQTAPAPGRDRRRPGADLDRRVRPRWSSGRFARRCRRRGSPPTPSACRRRCRMGFAPTGISIGALERVQAQAGRSSPLFRAQTEWKPTPTEIGRPPVGTGGTRLLVVDEVDRVKGRCAGARDPETGRGDREAGRRPTDVTVSTAWGGGLVEEPPSPASRPPRRPPQPRRRDAAPATIAVSRRREALGRRRVTVRSGERLRAHGRLAWPAARRRERLAPGPRPAGRRSRSGCAGSTAIACATTRSSGVRQGGESL